MSNPFFLTKQTANLMEDFARELGAGSALFLLYGEERVGKTRFLQELQRSRLQDRCTHWIDLKSNDDATSTAQDRSVEIAKVTEEAGLGDIIIADHFESASNTSRHQLFQKWVTDGVDKKLNLIVASATHGFKDLRQLSLHYKVRVQSFQQMPYSREEVDAFVGFYLFPDDPIGQLSMPAAVRMQLTNTLGNVGKVIDIADRDAEQIKSTPIVEAEENRRGNWMPAVIVALVVLLAGIGWYLNRQTASVEAQLATDTQPQTAVNAIPESEVEVISQVLPEAEVEAVETVVESIEGPATGAEIETEPQIEAEVVVEKDPGAVTEPVLEAETNANDTLVIAEDNNLEGQNVVIQATENGDRQLESGEPNEDNVQVTVRSTRHTPRFQKVLDDSLKWLNNNQRSRATIQIMWIGSGKFTGQAYYDYIDRLKSRRIDTSKIRIYQTVSGQSLIYGLVYGEYENRKLALNSIRNLPDVLKVNGPIPRTIGGIRDEINRRNTQN